jgi:hypothetical protein
LKLLLFWRTVCFYVWAKETALSPPPSR